VRDWPIASVSVAVLVVCLGSIPPVLAQPPASPVQAAGVDAAPLFRDILTRFYQAYARKDLPAIEALWHPKGPARHARNIVEMEFEVRTATLLGLSVTEAAITPGGGRARAIIDLSVVDAKTNRTRRERRVREVTFLEDQGTWKIWNDNPTASGFQIAARLLAASPEARAALIANDPEVRSDDGLAGLAFEVNRLRAEGKFAEVLDALSVRSALSRALGNERTLAASLLDTGLVCQVTGRIEEAGRAFTEARELYARNGTPADVAIIDSNLGAVEYVRGEYARAADCYRRALEVFEGQKDSPRIASALHGLGNALYMQGDFEQAMTAYQRCLGLHEAAADRYSASQVLQAMAMVHKEVGSYAAAVEAYSRGAALSAAVGDQVGSARAEHGLGDVHRLLGDYSRALQHFAAGLAWWEKTPDTVNRAATMYAIGQVHALQRNFPRAVEWYERALELDRRAGEKGGLARDLGGLGGAHFGQGQLELALGEYRQSLAIREELKDVPGIMWTVTHIGVLETASGQLAEGLRSYQRALGIAEQTGDAGAVCTILALRAANELLRDDAESALASAAKASEMAERLELFDALSNAKVTAGKAQRKSGLVTEAIASFREAVTALERIPIGPGVETFFDDRRSPYLALVDLLATEKDAPASGLADAFLAWERARTRSLANLLGGDGAVVVKDMTPEERDAERALTRATRTLTVRLRRERGRSKPDPDRVAAVGKELEQAVTERAVFRRKLFEAHPSLPVLRAQSEPAGLEAASRVLAPPEALVSFAVMEQRTHVFFVADHGAGAAPGRATGVRTIEVKASDLGAKVAAFRDAIVRRDPRAVEAGRELHDLLLSPVRESIRRARSVVVVPDVFLWALPFEALQDGRGRYLVQDFAVSYAPSLTALAAMREARRSDSDRRPTLLAAADPAIPAAALDRLSLLRPPASAPFPAAAREVRSLALVFGPQASQVLTREHARAARVSAVRPGGALHLAAPGSLLETSPLFSLLALSPSGPEDPDHGLVEIGDAIGWTLPAAVVSFSRMDVGAGGINGEALTALAWAFHVAGTGSVIVNRWLPQDADSRTVTGFYRAWLARGTPSLPQPTPAAAMQKAARALVAAPGTHPADWAGFMVIGR